MQTVSLQDRSASPCAKIVSFSSAGELVCASAARISTTQGTALSILERSKEKENNSALIEKVVASGHQSLIEHAVFTIAFDNVSVCTEEFVIEFRLASYTVQSRRYVDFTNAGFYVPAMSEGCEAQYCSHMQSLFDCYGKLLALEIPKEDARFVLPYCFRSNFYCTLNARELMHMIAAMLWGRGREIPELQEIGASLKSQFEQYFPNLLSRVQMQYADRSDCKDRRYCLPQMAPAIAEPTVGSARAVLQYATPDPEKIVCAAAASNGAYSAENAALSLAEIVNAERPRELELIHAMFRIEGLSLAAVTHLVRHRMQSVLVPQIMQAITQNCYVLPETIAQNSEAAALYHRAFAENTAALRRLLSMGMPISVMQYFAMAGHLLDCSCAMDGRELKHFFALRTCQRAQWEIRAVATELLSQLRKESELYRLFGPSCYTANHCPEGRLSCGKAKEMRALFSAT